VRAASGAKSSSNWLNTYPLHVCLSLGVLFYSAAIVVLAADIGLIASARPYLWHREAPFKGSSPSPLLLLPSSLTAPILLLQPLSAAVGLSTRVNPENQLETAASARTLNGSYRVPGLRWFASVVDSLHLVFYPITIKCHPSPGSPAYTLALSQSLAQLLHRHHLLPPLVGTSVPRYLQRGRLCT
jgi:hypothetical protein